MMSATATGEDTNNINTIVPNTISSQSLQKEGGLPSMMDSSFNISGDTMFTTPQKDTKVEGRDSYQDSRRSPFDGYSAYRRSPSPALEEAKMKEQIRQLRAQIKQLQSESNAEMETAAQLRRKVNQLERDKVELTSSNNDEVSKLHSQNAKLRAQLEKGEATRQSLQYELTVARKNVSQEQRLSTEKELELNNIIASNKDKIAELTDLIEDLQRKLENNKSSATDEEVKLRRIIDEKDAVISKCYAEQDFLQTEKDKLEIVIQEKDSLYADAEEKIESLEIERNAQTDTVRRQLGDLEYAAEREERLKKELEVAINRIKSLEENIEAERAAHLESKFNSEIVQLRVRDLEGAFEVEKSAHTEANMNIDMISKQLKEVEKAFEDERNNSKNLKQKLEQVTKEYAIVKKQLTGDLEDKKDIINNMSKQLELHQKNFNELKEELNKAKKRQVYLEETYGGSMRELELLLHNFQVDGKKRAHERKPSKDKPLTPSLVLETLRHTLMDYQTRLDATSSELSKMKTHCEKLSTECDSYKEMTWSRNKTVEQMQKRLEATIKELERVRSELTESETRLAAYKLDLQKTSHSYGKEKNKVQDLKEDIGRLNKQYQNEDENKRIYLHGLYQRILAGRPVFENSEQSITKFTWDELSVTVQEQIASMMTAINRAQQKIQHLEQVIRSKDDTMKQLQISHDENVEKLANASKEREDVWKKEKDELEGHYSQLLAEVHTRSKKTQAVADQAWEKLRHTGSLREGLESECAELRKLLSQSQHEHSSLLSTCALLIGALIPLYNRATALSNQRDLLEEQLGQCHTFKEQARILVETLSQELGGSEQEPEVKEKPARNASLLFRSGAIAVMAANRLNHFVHSSRRVFTSYDLPGNMTSSVVCMRGGQSKEKQFTGVGLGGDVTEQSGESANQILDWLSSPNLLMTILDSVADLQEVISKTCVDDVNQPGSSKLVVSAARNAFGKLMTKLRPEFETATLQQYPVHGFREKGSLVRQLGHGLNRVLAHDSMAGKLQLASAHQTMVSLQKHILEFTQRLHTAEVDRRAVRLDNVQLHQENEDLRIETTRLAAFEGEVVKLRDEVNNTVAVERFDSICHELNNALQREQQAQELLNEQSSQLEELSIRLNAHSNEELERNAAIAEAAKNLSEAKMEMKRREQTIRQLNRNISQLENDKKQFQEQVYDAESTLRLAAREKEVLSNYMRSVENTLVQHKHQILSARTSPTTIDTSLPKLLPSTLGDMKMGPEMLASQNLVVAINDVQQALMSRVSVLEGEIQSHKKHIETLKKEFSAACRREYDEADFPGNERPRYDRNGFEMPSERSFGRSRPLYEPERSYAEDFAPLREEVDNSALDSRKSTPFS
ncbi:coiled-coil domain-containing protein 171-like isoform X2 [Ptychodera flava]|uniref:coiled-coil domain-containing protein 171-like isoform X2 n=1 Tax=Ptychodera flava TaxID=63121 RepID=UPI00396A9863